MLTIAGNALNLLIPKLVADAIDSYGRRTLVLGTVAPGLLLAAAGILIFGYLQGIVQTYAADRVARDLRTRLITRIAAQDPAYIQQITPAALLTHLTSDVDAVKMFVAMAIASLISSVFLIVGASVLLIAIDWRLALAVLAMLPVIGFTFSVVLGRVRTLFKRGAGSDRLAEQGHQREHPRRGADPARQLAAVRVRQVRRRQYRGARHQPERSCASFRRSSR